MPESSHSVVRYFNIETLTQAIDLGEKLDFNRQLLRSALDGMLPGGHQSNFLMVHEHRHGEPVEPHARVLIHIRTQNGTTEAIMDVPMDFWQSLPVFPVTRSADAPAWEAAGNKWEPDLHFTGSADKVEIRFVHSLLCRFGDGVVAHHIYQPLPRTYSVELQFGKSPDAREWMHQCRNAYHQAFTASGKLKPSIAKDLKRAG